MARPAEVRDVQTIWSERHEGNLIAVRGNVAIGHIQLILENLSFRERNLDSGNNSNAGARLRDRNEFPWASDVGRRRGSNRFRVPGTTHRNRKRNGQREQRGGFGPVALYHAGYLLNRTRGYGTHWSRYISRKCKPELLHRQARLDVKGV